MMTEVCFVRETIRLRAEFVLRAFLLLLPSRLHVTTTTNTFHFQLDHEASGSADQAN